jgi:hypothetical protein
MSEIDAWCNKATKLVEKILEASKTFEYLSNTYEDIRIKSHKDKHRERIDKVYGDLYDVKNRFCALKAGGKRKTMRKIDKK